MPTKTNLFFLCIFSFQIILNAQISDSILARVGNEIISVEEFKNRFELMPHLNYPTKNIDSLKEMFLSSLVAERLWYSEAIEKQIDTSEVIRNSINTLKNLIIKDEVFRNEVESKVSFTTYDLAKGMNRINKILFVKVITSKDSLEIESIYNQLHDGKSFDSLLSLRNEFRYQEKPIKVTIGSIDDENAEDIIFNLQVGEISPLISFKNQWYIFKLIQSDIDSTIIINTDENKNKIKSIFTDRRRRLIGGKFIDNLIGGKSINANKSLVNYFPERLYELLKTQKQNSTDTLSVPDINELDYSSLLHQLNKDKLNAPLFTLNSLTYSLKDFVYYLIYQKIDFTSIKLSEIQFLIQKALRDFIESCMIVQYGKEKNYDSLPSVKKYIKTWISFYYSESMMQSIADSLKRVKSSFKFNINKEKPILNKTQVNIAEVLVKDISTAAEILNEIQNGTDFKLISSRYNEKENAKNSYYEWGYFIADYAGEIGDISSRLNIGEIYGPIKTSEGYSFIKLIDKKILNDSLFTENNEDKEFEQMKNSFTQLNKILNDKTLKLYKKYKIEINRNILKSLEVSSLNTFTYRLIGFGGKIAAYPITIPLYEWTKELSKKSVVP